MPRRPTTTREDMIEGAFHLVRREGIEALTARNLATALGCSTQPIMYQFPNLAELKELVYRRADQFHTEYILSAGDFLEIGLRYIRFAAEEKPLFRFLFQSGHFDGESVADMIRMPESEQVLQEAAKGLELPVEEAAAVFEALFIMVHGYASLIANNAMPYDPASIAETLQTVAESFFEKGEEK